MANLVLGFPIVSDDSVSQTPDLSGGDWESDLPLSNLQDRRLSKVARSTDDALASTRLHYDLGTSRDVRLWAIPKHNFSKTGGYVRVLAEVEDLLFDYEAGDDIAERGGTFTRATTATYVDRNGIVRTAASGVIRDAHFIDGVRHTLLEPARTNICLRSQEFDNASWSKTRSSVSANADTAPDGTTTADRLVDTVDNNTHIVFSASTFAITGNANVAISCYAKRSANRTGLRITFQNSDGSVTVFRNFELTDGSLGTTVSTGTAVLVSSGVEALGNGWFRCWIVANLGGGITTARANFAVGLTGATLSYAGDGASYISLWGAQVEDSAAFPTSYIATTTASVTRNADVLEFTAANLDTPQALTSYCKFVNLDEVGVNRRVWQISGANDLGPRHLLYRASTLTLYHQNANGGTAVTSGPAGAVAIGDLVEFRGVLSGDGSVIGHKTVNGGAETSGSTSAINTPAAAWGSAGTSRLYINADGAGTQVGSMALRSLRFMAGERSLSEIRAA